MNFASGLMVTHKSSPDCPKMYVTEVFSDGQVLCCWVTESKKLRQYLFHDFELEPVQYSSICMN